MLLSAVLPVALIISAGVLAGRYLRPDQPTLTRLALYLLVPALAFDNIYSTSLALGSALGILSGCILTYLALYGITLGLGRMLALPRPVRSSLVATTVFANAGNVGLPVVFFSLGTAGLERATIYLIAAGLFMATLAPALFGGTSLVQGARLTLRMPTLYAALLALACRLLGLQLPYRLDEGIRLLGQASIPILLLSLGVQISRSELRYGRYEIGASLLRLVLAPPVAWGIGRLLGLTGLDLAVLVLESSMPTAVNAFLLSAEFGGDAARTARVVVSSTLLAFVSIPIVLWALGVG